MTRTTGHTSTEENTRATSDAAAADRTAELVARLDAVERTLTGTDAPVSDLEDLAAVEERVSDLESTVETLTERMDDIDAATQAIRGYLGGVRAVNESVERRADAALAKAESLEAALVDESDAARQQSSIAQATASPEPTDGVEHGPADSAAGDDADALNSGLAARLRDVL
ncbi:DUF7310 family coiled-coil domain-containing protein [Haloferax larsenii]|uniref:DUF7310 domain-containing protein n=1 Tax=Haloferax larsenii TaxID=302484 RepID=A0A1H7GRK7_HALLR|nr:hypothetical protein [Haloferax larsenii]SEK40147.1 hypothetical protein SAMN04488691_101366 [Haloferax larsenii]